MGFYLRKSVSAGPFRFNLSSSGLGVSAGVKGLTVGTGPRATYVHMGAHGLYYRTSLSDPRRPGSAAPVAWPSMQVVHELPEVTVTSRRYADTSRRNDRRRGSPAEVTRRTSSAVGADTRASRLVPGPSPRCQLALVEREGVGRPHGLIVWARSASVHDICCGSERIRARSRARSALPTCGKISIHV